MGWGVNLINNPSAETQDTTDWSVNNVYVEENITSGLKYLPIIDERETWNEDTYKSFAIYGPSGTYCFVFASDNDANMSQVLYASDIGVQPDSFQFNVKFKLSSKQDYWDTSVLGMAKLSIFYTDGTKDDFIIPCIRGVYISDRFLVDFWTMVYTICNVNTEKVLNYVQIYISKISDSRTMYLDLVELRKEEA